MKRPQMKRWTSLIPYLHQVQVQAPRWPIYRVALLQVKQIQDGDQVLVLKTNAPWQTVSSRSLKLTIFNFQESRLHQIKVNADFSFAQKIMTHNLAIEHLRQKLPVQNKCKCRLNPQYRFMMKLKNRKYWKKQQKGKLEQSKSGRGMKNKCKK